MNSYFINLKSKIQKKTINISIFGVGYVGIRLVIAFAKKGYKVHCFDQDYNKLKKLSKGLSPFSYISNKEIKDIKKNLKFHRNFKNVENSDVIIMCLPTPLMNNKPDLSHIKSCWKKIKPFTKKGQMIILESTTYPGCTEELFYRDLEKKFKIDKEIFLSYSPERENPGDVNFNFKNTPKVVSGIGENSLYLSKILYNLITKKTIISPSIKIAEMSKLLENIYRSINIALINELKIATKKLDLDLYKVIEIAETKPFGFQKFLPGPGTGGHCIPIDPLYFSWISKKSGFDVRFIKLSSQINEFRTKWIIKKILNIAKKLKLSKVLLLGMSYKKNIEDTRESASIKIFQEIYKKRLTVNYCDPFNKKFIFKINNRKLLKRSLQLNKLTISKHDMIIISADHDNFNYELIKSTKKIIIDLRGKFKNVHSKNIYQL